MSADVLYQEMGLAGYRVEDTWQGKDDAVYVLLSLPRESLRCRCVASVGTGIFRRVG